MRRDRPGPSSPPPTNHRAALGPKNSKISRLRRITPWPVQTAYCISCISLHITAHYDVTLASLSASARRPARCLRLAHIPVLACISSATKTPPHPLSRPRALVAVRLIRLLSSLFRPVFVSSRHSVSPPCPLEPSPALSRREIQTWPRKRSPTKDDKRLQSSTCIHVCKGTPLRLSISPLYAAFLWARYPRHPHTIPLSALSPSNTQVAASTVHIKCLKAHKISDAFSSG